MSDQFVAEIKMFAGNFAPTGWAFCNGQLMSISQNTALFSLLGTMYGGDGRSTFGLPDLQNKSPMFWGSGAGLTERFIGEEGGASSVTLLTGEIPLHNHIMNASTSAGGLGGPGSAAFGAGGRGRPAFYTNTYTKAVMGYPTAPAGSSIPHNNRQPYLGINFIIALQGIFPPRP